MKKIEKKLNFPMMKNEHLSDEASAIIIEELQHGKLPKLPDEVLEHMESCNNCKEKIFDVITFLRNPDTKNQKTIKVLKQNNFQRHRNFISSKIAAVIMVFAFLAIAYFYVFQNSPIINDFSKNTMVDDVNNSEQTTEANSIHKASALKEKENQISNQEVKPLKETSATDNQPLKKQSKNPRYRINPNLESMIGSRLRSGIFEVINPKNLYVVNETIKFNWKNHLEEPHTIKIVNNQNLIIYQHPVVGKSFQFKETLKNGLYYWKLENKNELLYVGKFFVGSPPQ